MKGSAFAWFSVSHNKSIMVLDDFLAYSQSDSCTRIFILIMQALEKLKYLLCILLVETNTIVADTEHMVVFASHSSLSNVIFARYSFGTDLYFNRNIRLAVFNGVADNIL